MSEQGPLAELNPASGPYINHHMSSRFINVHTLSHCPRRLSGSKFILIFCVTKVILRTPPRPHSTRRARLSFTGPANSLHIACNMCVLTHNETLRAVAENIVAVSQMMCSVQSQECPPVVQLPSGLWDLERRLLGMHLI